MRGLFDFSEISANHFNYFGFPDDRNKGTIGLFKNKTTGNPIIKFVVFKLKMYFIEVCKCETPDSNTQPQMSDKQVGKGIARAMLMKTTDQQYVEMIEESEVTKITNRRIASKLYQAFRNMT